LRNYEVNTSVSELQRIYGESFKEIELCFTIRPDTPNTKGAQQHSFPATRMPRHLGDNTGILQNMLSHTTNSYQLRTRDTFVTYRGGKNKKMSKRKRKIKSQIKYKPKRKTKKIYQRGGIVSSAEELAQAKQLTAFLKIAKVDPNINTDDTMPADIIQNMNG
jgi:hypothetical protein